MRLQAFTLSLLASAGLATPLRRDINQAVYTLRLSSSESSLNGLYLTTNPNPSSNPNATTLGVSTSNPAAGPSIKFYPVLNPSTQLSELRTTPSSSDTALAVVGTNGLLDFARLADPAGQAGSVPEGTTVDWTSFRLDEAAGTVGYGGKDAEGRWVAFPVGGEAWAVKWKDVSAWTTQNYLPVQVVYELVKEQ